MAHTLARVGRPFAMGNKMCSIATCNITSYSKGGEEVDGTDIGFDKIDAAILIGREDSSTYDCSVEVDSSGEYISQSTATITISDYTELNNGDKVNLVATDGTSHDFTVGDQSSVNGTFEATTSNNATATNLMNVINTSSGPSGTRFTAEVSSAVVTATQAVKGADGNTTVTLTDSGTAGMTKTNFLGGLNTTFSIWSTNMDGTNAETTAATDIGMVRLMIMGSR